MNRRAVVFVAALVVSCGGQTSGGGGAPGSSGDGETGVTGVVSGASSGMSLISTSGVTTGAVSGASSGSVTAGATAGASAGSVSGASAGAMSGSPESGLCSETTCPTGQTCQNGTCCPAASTACNVSGGSPASFFLCFDLQTDSNNCGGCNQACPTGQTCGGGICVSCPSGETACDGTSAPAVEGGHRSCVNEQTDPNNCGGCGIQCSPAAPSCENGNCHPAVGSGSDAAVACPNTIPSAVVYLCDAGPPGTVGCQAAGADPNRATNHNVYPQGCIVILPLEPSLESYPLCTVPCACTLFSIDDAGSSGWVCPG